MSGVAVSCSLCSSPVEALTSDGEEYFDRVQCSNSTCPRHGIAFSLKAWAVVNTTLPLPCGCETKCTTCTCK